ncbi:hypothetical protein [Cellulosimicrobium marinum]|uniref:hypothetical protein n=1 Tax=Cellulosimicrobium marinum TaxID=1638992 RepID=UPI001E37BDAE|nr:hypothetical protein [Cellulosimicrobium marinum]MCB7137189.1 hypothetical protein [Cellulosimicrobium marinum]
MFKVLCRGACTAAAATVAALAIGASVPAVAAAAPSTPSVVVAAAAPAKPTGLKHVQITSGQTATFSVKKVSGLTYTWQYRPYGETQWRTLAGKTGSSISIKGTSARDAWQVRAVARNGSGQTTPSGWAFLLVHSTITDPYAVGTPAWLTRWTTGMLDTTYGSSTVVGSGVALRDPADADPFSNLRFAFRDASGAWSTATVKKTAVDTASGTIEYTLTAKPSAAARASAVGDVWKVRDASTNEYEYFATE